MELPSDQQLLDSISSFRARHGDMAVTRFGREATGEPQLVSSIEKGRSPSLAVLRRVAEYMRRKDIDAGHVASDTTAEEASSPGNAGDLSAVRERAA